MKKKDSILIIYTGGTIGMQKNPETGTLVPFDFSKIMEHIPELKLIDKKIDAVSFEKFIDSSNMKPELWIKIAGIIEENYYDYDGFVILHGSDTMAYTASALSFMLENLSKPVILTGSQLPIGDLRTDAKENIITSIEIAGSYENGRAIVPEVGIYFEFKLLRGNRTTKANTEHFNAFDSPNYGPLALSGVNIKFYKHRILSASHGLFNIHKNLSQNIIIVRVHPALTRQQFEHVLQTPDLEAVILETYGSGNAMTEAWFLEAVKSAIDKGIYIINVSQCQSGSIAPEKYETGKKLMNLGVLNGKDLTTESALTKMMYLLGNKMSKKGLKKVFESPLKGEMTV